MPKVTSTDGTKKAYIADAAGGQSTIDVTGSVVGNTIVQRISGGHIQVPTVTSTSSPNYVANKKYVDENFVAKQTAVTQYNQAYIKTTAGEQNVKSITPQAIADAIPIRNTSSLNFAVGTPISSQECANKAYVDDGFVAKTQIATDTDLGLVKSAKSYGFVVTSVGAPSADTLSLSEYTNASVAAFIGKGTLQNIIGLVDCSIILGGVDSFVKRIPAYLKNEPESYVGACCVIHDERHVIIGFDQDNAMFLVYNTADGTTIEYDDYTIE